MTFLCECVNLLLAVFQAVAEVLKLFVTTSIKATLASSPVSLLSVDMNMSFTSVQQGGFSDVASEVEVDEAGESIVRGFFDFCKCSMVQSLL